METSFSCKWTWTKTPIFGIGLSLLASLIIQKLILWQGTPSSCNIAMTLLYDFSDKSSNVLLIRFSIIFSFLFCFLSLLALVQFSGRMLLASKMDFDINQEESWSNLLLFSCFCRNSVWYNAATSEFYVLEKDARCSIQSDSEMLERVSVFYCRIKTLGILETWEGSVAKFMLHKYKGWILIHYSAIFILE